MFSLKGMLRVFNEHVQGLFCEEHCSRRIFNEVMHLYWGFGAQEIIQRKVEDERAYRERLRGRFARDADD